MKKYILLLICFFCISNADAIALYNSYSTAFIKPIRIRINFDIARPALNCESGIGICNVNGGVGRVGGDGRQVSAECYVENAIMVVSILKAYATSEVQDQLSNTTYYTIDDDVKIPQDVVESLG